MLRRVIRTGTALLAGLALPLVAPAEDRTAEGKIDRERVIGDLRHLARTLEDVHPDPYVRGGGRLAFHRRLHRAIGLVPDEGMTAAELMRVAQPLAAGIGDGHTRVEPARGMTARGLALPLDFTTVEGRLFVTEVYAAEHAELLAARVDAVDGIDFESLLRRQRELAGSDNASGHLDHLQRSLRWKNGIEGLIPGLAARDAVVVSFTLRDGERRDVRFAGPVKIVSGDGAQLRSRIRLPGIADEPAWSFLDERGHVALLSIPDMFSYREAFEWFRHHDYDVWDDARAIWSRYNEGSPPDERDRLIAGIPAASETLRELASEMQRAGTRTLIVDLRLNSGGNSLLAAILVHRLFGVDGLLQSRGGYSIPRYSDLYFEFFRKSSLEEINGSRGWSLVPGDYDFTPEGRAPAPVEPGDLEAHYRERTPTFAAQLADPGVLYRPPNVAVVTSPATQSSALTLAARLWNLGASVVGVTPGQGPNHFGEVLTFELPATGLRVHTSSKLHVFVPDDPLGYTELPVDHPLTLELWKGYDYDRHAALLLARDAFPTP